MQYKNVSAMTLIIGYAGRIAPGATVEDSTMPVLDRADVRTYVARGLLKAVGKPCVKKPAVAIAAAANRESESLKSDPAEESVTCENPAPAEAPAAEEVPAQAAEEAPATDAASVVEEEKPRRRNRR